MTHARITAELLKVVNSTALGLPSKVTRVADAVKLIGVNRTVALVLSTHLLGNNGRKPDPLSQAFEQRLRHAPGAYGLDCRDYAAMTGNPASDLAYVLGLLQDVGILALLNELGTRYQNLLERCADDPDNSS